MVSWPSLSRKMIRCGLESLFSQRTMDPAFTVIVCGVNAKFLIVMVFSDTDAWLIGVGTVVISV